MAAAADFELYYWSVPFRGQFVRAVLAYADRTWTESGDEKIAELMAGPVADMPVPFMGPPLLVDRKAGFAISQMSAVVMYLGETLDLLPKSPSLRALAMKVIADANDVIDEITQEGGRRMWSRTSWRKFQPRLEKWMSLWEEIGRRHGLTADAGFLLGGKSADVADIVTATLWSTMTERLPPIEATLERVAPHTAALVKRMAALPSLRRLATASRRDYGAAYCGGEIEKSLRKVVLA